MTKFVDPATGISQPARQIHKNVFVLGIQPKSTEFGAEISSEVRLTLDLLQRLITRNSVSRSADKPS